MCAWAIFMEQSPIALPTNCCSQLYSAIGFKLSYITYNIDRPEHIDCIY